MLSSTNNIEGPIEGLSFWRCKRGMYKMLKEICENSQMTKIFTEGFFF